MSWSDEFGSNNREFIKAIGPYTVWRDLSDDTHSNYFLTDKNGHYIWDGSRLSCSSYARFCVREDILFS